MRWKEEPRKKPPEKGAVRIIRRFLFFPQTVDHETRWLETAHIVQTYVPSQFFDPSGEYSYRASWWWSRRWTTEDEYRRQR